MQSASKKSALRLLRTFVTASSKHQTSASSIEQSPESKPSANSVTGPGPPSRFLPGPGLSHFLEDNHGRFHNYLRISVSERCNLRCSYCMPEAGVDLTPNSKLLTTEEMVRLAKVFATHGVDKIRLTGGEPLVRKDIVHLVKQLKLEDLMLGQNCVKDIDGISTVAMTTNGLTLGRHLPPLLEAGLDAVNISLDTLHDQKFEFVSRRPKAGHSKVLRAIDSVMESGLKLKINCVVMRGMNDDEMVDFVDWTRDKKLILRFIEYMPFDGNRWNDKKMVPYKEMVEVIQRKHPDFQRVVHEDEENDTSKAWTVPGFEGRVGFITSMSQNFCGSCNRLRLTADGHLKVCLFGASEIDLKQTLRKPSDENADLELIETIGRAVKRKKSRHAGMFNIANSKNRPMILIGG